MDGSLDFAACEAASGLRLRIVGAVYLDDLSVLVLYKAFALYKIRVHQADLIAREQPEILLRRLLHKVLPLNIQFPAEGYFAAAQLLVFQVVGSVQVFHLSFGIIVDHKLDRIQHRHHAGPLQLQILADAVLQHGVVHGGLALGNAAEIHEHLDGLRRKAAAL